MRRVVFVLVVALLVAGGRTAPRAHQGPQQPIFKSGTELVEVNAIVQDGDGQFVSGLSADDFQVYEDGKAQEIQLFYLVTGPSAVVPRAKVAEGVPRAPDQTARRLFTIFFDQEHLNFESFRQVQRAALGFLQENFRPGDVGGVVTNGGMANNRLTTARDEIISAVRNARPDADVRERQSVFREWPRLESEFEALRLDAGDARVLNDAVMRNCQERPDECNRPGITENVENTLQWNARHYLDQERAASLRLIQALSAVSTALGRIEGRKTLVLLTEGFLVEESRGVIAQVAARAARSGVTIYAIDARGLARASTGMSDASQPGPRLSPSVFDTNDDGPNILTVETGGFVVRNSNDFVGALNAIADDTSTYYVLGYSSGNPALDGKFRKIEVKVNWKRMNVRARKGYLATPLPPPMRARSLNAGDMDVQPMRPPSAFLQVSDMFARPDPETRVRELLALDPKMNAAPPAADAASAAAAPASAAERGWERYQNGDLEGARRELASAATEKGAAPWVSYALGLAESGLGHYREASVALERVRTEEPDFKPAYLDLADGYLQSGEPKKAADALRDACARWPRDTDVWNALGVALLHQRGLDAAIDAFRQAASLDPRDALALFNLGQAFEQRYLRSRRWDGTRRVSTANEDDRAAARAHYERYLAIGGPFETQARAALSSLEGVK